MYKSNVKILHIVLKFVDGCSLALTSILIILKLIGVVSCGWLCVLSPIWIWLIIYLLILSILLITRKLIIWERYK